MPVTFIHGVNVRTGLAYEKGVAARDELLRRLVLRPLGESKSAAWAEMDIHSPYWGEDAVSFAWDFASLPQVGVAKAMGPKTEDTSDADLELALFAPENKTRSAVRALGDSSSGFKAAALKTPMLFVEAVSQTRRHSQSLLAHREKTGRC